MYSTDELMLQLHRALCDDMTDALGLTGRGFLHGRFTVAELRNKQFMLHDNLTPYEYKWGAQLNSLLKRYVFENDILTPSEREELTNEKFIKLQTTLATNYWRQRTTRLHKVLCKARSICTRILCGFEPQGDYHKGQFGQKATVGCPASSAYIDLKLLAKPLTGSACHIEWCKKHLVPNDKLLRSILEESPCGFQRTVSLAQVNVPKKYNIDRGINPNSLIGSLYSSSLGRIVQEALKEEGLDIQRLQERHGILARRASTKGRLVTADLSDASHGFLSNILNALLPRRWYRACMFGVIRQVEVDGRAMRLESIMTMGIGFTFPIQTLLFYCLLKAMADLSGIKGTISVYGDDLIYPKNLHKFVVGIFSDLGFKLNLDKTFVQSPFRESCGSDFFRGQDVRPFSPEGSSEHIGPKRYAAFCYSLINGLRARWEPTEIKRCLRLLKFEVLRAMDVIYVVPSHYPVTSGLTSGSEYKRPVVENSWLEPVAAWQWDPEMQSFLFPRLMERPRRRYVMSVTPYYWDLLRSSESFRDTVPLPPLWASLSTRPSTFRYRLSKADEKKFRRSCQNAKKKGRKKPKFPTELLRPTVATKDGSSRYEVTRDRIRHSVEHE